MQEFVEIGGALRKGLGQTILERFHEAEGVQHIFVEAGRADDLFAEKEFGTASEVDLLTLVVEKNQAEQVFTALYDALSLGQEPNGLIYQSPAFIKTA
ncbi:MAG: hypothetical protein ACON41_03195 [Parvibaculales bacterium]